LNSPLWHYLSLLLLLYHLLHLHIHDTTWGRAPTGISHIIPVNVLLIFLFFFWATLPKKHQFLFPFRHSLADFPLSYLFGLYSPLLNILFYTLETPLALCFVSNTNFLATHVKWWHVVDGTRPVLRLSQLTLTLVKFRLFKDRFIASRIENVHKWFACLPVSPIIS
jgi:hypothetical protein